MSALDERACPSAVDLLEYAEGQLGQSDSVRVGEHVAQCGACADVLENLRASTRVEQVDRAGAVLSMSIPEDAQQQFAERAARFRELLRLAPPEAPRFGQLWATKLSVDDKQRFAPGLGVVPRIVVVLAAKAGSEDSHGSHLVVAPISLDIAYRSSDDLVVFEEESPLGYRFMVEVWNEVTMHQTQLGRYLGGLRQPAKRYLGLLYQTHLGIEVDRSGFAARVGPAIRHSADPRVRFQEQEIEACEYLRRPLLERIEQKAALREVEHSDRGVLLVLRDLTIKHGRLPSAPREVREALPLAAATGLPETKSYFVHDEYAGGEVLIRLVDHLATGSLYLSWEQLPEPLRGALARVSARTRTGETYIVEQPSVRQGVRTLLAQGAKVRRNQVESLTVEFVTTENGNGAIEHCSES